MKTVQGRVFLIFLVSMLALIAGNAVFEAYSNSNSADYVFIDINKISEKKTELLVKYGKKGNSII